MASLAALCLRVAAGLGLLGTYAAPRYAEAAYIQQLAGTSSNDVWVFANYGHSCSSGDSFVAAHYDGVGWTRTRTPVIGACFYVQLASAAAPDDVWVIGQDPRTAAAIGLGYGCFHWNGKVWLECPAVPSRLLPVDPQEPQVTSIAVGTQSDVWLIGSYFTQGSLFVYAQFALHWDGSAWSIGSFGNPPAFGYAQAYNISSDKHGGVWALTVSHKDAGTQTLYDESVEHFDGKTWSVNPLPVPRDTNISSIWSGLSGVDAGELVMRRQRTNAATAKQLAAISFYDHGLITTEHVPSGALEAPVAASSKDDVWTFPILVSKPPGLTILSPPSALHFDDAGRHAMTMAVTNPPSVSVSAALSFSGSTAWAITESGPMEGGYAVTFLEHWDGVRWTQSAIP